MPQRPLRVIPLGGLGEIGKNMMALEYNRDIIVIDAGVLFPEEDMLGVDLVIPDISYLVQHSDRVRGIFITHGHEDHTGALPYVLRALDVPVYASRLTLGLIAVKLKEHKALRSTKLIEVQPGKEIRAGAFRVELVPGQPLYPRRHGVGYQDAPWAGGPHRGLQDRPYPGRWAGYGPHGAFPALCRRGVPAVLRLHLRRAARLHAVGTGGG